MQKSIGKSMLQALIGFIAVVMIIKLIKGM